MTGIEALSLIPGTAGATPVQNVGAYGQEISSVLVSVEVYDTQAKRFFNIPAIECGLGYRTSRFKTTDRGRFAITAITLHLMHGNPAAPFYKTVTDYFIAHNITSPTPQLLRQAVIDIRRSKLPDVDKVANNGSFFANPVVSEEQLLRLRDNYSGIPGWPAEEGKRTIPAAWLIEQAGLKGVHDPETGMATWDTQPLVLVNEHAQSTAQLLQFKQKIINVVSRQFGITLEQEPELLP
jgi:UDP-N-acetylmuramate dehydrogenase